LPVHEAFIINRTAQKLSDSTSAKPGRPPAAETATAPFATLRRDRLVR